VAESKNFPDVIGDAAAAFEDTDDFALVVGDGKFVQRFWLLPPIAPLYRFFFVW